MPLKIAIAMGVALLIFRVGFGVLKGFATPIPGPPPEGDMRKLKRVYRCSSCGLEMRTLLAGSDDPAPPRHCMDEMDLTKTEEDFL